MAAIHGKDTKPEMVVRRYLWGHGFRYRLNHPRQQRQPQQPLLCAGPSGQQPTCAVSQRWRRGGQQLLPIWRADEHEHRQHTAVQVQRKGA